MTTIREIDIAIGFIGAAALVIGIVAFASLLLLERAGHKTGSSVDIPQQNRAAI